MGSSRGWTRRGRNVREDGLNNVKIRGEVGRHREVA
jgi:hypothetical protein